MIDCKKVMEGLSDIRNEIVDGYINEPERAVNTLTDALELLKEKEPVKPIRQENWWECPACSGNIVANMKYCPGCGRQVKWVA